MTCLNTVESFCHTAVWRRNNFTVCKDHWLANSRTALLPFKNPKAQRISPQTLWTYQKLAGAESDSVLLYYNAAISWFRRQRRRLPSSSRMFRLLLLRCGVKMEKTNHCVLLAFQNKINWTILKGSRIMRRGVPRPLPTLKKLNHPRCSYVASFLYSLCPFFHSLNSIWIFPSEYLHSTGIVNNNNYNLFNL